jgi:acyl carrier protein
VSSDQPWGWEAFRDIACAALSDVLDNAVADLKPGDHLLDDIGLDSFGLLVFAAELEVRIGIGIPPSLDEPTGANMFQLVTSALQRQQAESSLVNGGAS